MRSHVCKKSSILAQQLSITSARSRNGVVAIQKRYLHESTLPQGRGGRSSFSGVVSTVFGANGFVGHSVVNHLGSVGSSVVIPYRGGFDRVQRLRLMGDLGQIHLREDFSINLDDDAIHALIEHSNCVVNLIGTRHPVNFYTMEEVNVEWPKRLARLVAEKGDGTKLVHLTNINCAHEEGRNASAILRQQYEAEQGMKEIYPETTIVRSSNIYGFADKYTFVFLDPKFDTSILSFLGSVPLLYNGGKSTVIQPAHLGDIAEGITRALRHPDAPGRIFEFVGRNRYVLKDFIEYIYKSSQRDMLLYDPIGPMDRSKANVLQKILHNVLDFYFWRQSKPTVFLPRIIDLIIRQGGKKSMWMTEDFYKMLHVTDRTTGKPGLNDLGITPVENEERLYDYLAFNLGEEFIVRPSTKIPEAPKEISKEVPSVQHLLA